MSSNLNLYLFQSAIFIIILSEKYPRIIEFPEETVYFDSNLKNHQKFSYLDDEKISKCNLSIIVPAFNEEIRCEYKNYSYYYYARIKVLFEFLNFL